MKKNKWIFAVGLLSSLLLASCASNEDDKTPTIHFAHIDDVKSWDPATAYDVISLDVAPTVYETLYQFDYLSATYKVQPLLAADMPKYSKDRLTVTIPLRKGILFQDDPCFKATNGKGRELKAQDFIYAWKRLATPQIESQGWWIFDGKLKGINALRDRLSKTPKTEQASILKEEIEGMRALDDYTLQIKLTKPYPQLMYVLSMTFTSPVAVEAVQSYGDNNGLITDKPVGTGPFVLKSWRRGQRIVLEKNPNFHPDFYPTTADAEFRARGYLEDAGKKLPLSDRISIEVIREQQPAWLNFLSGKLDVATIPKDTIPKAVVQQTNLSPELAAKGLRLHIESGVTFYWISFNVRDPLFKTNKYLRQAISSAINREVWIDVISSGTGKKMVHSLPPGFADRPSDPSKMAIKYDYNLERAKELLKKAGYPGGKGLPTLSMDLRGADSIARQLGELFSKQFAAIGINLNVIYNTFPAFLEKIKKGNVQITYSGWTLDYPDAENIYQLLYGPNQAPGPNEGNYDNPVMNKLYEQIAIMNPSKERSALVAKADEFIQEEVPWAFGFYMSSYRVSQPWIHNFRSSDIILNKYKYYRTDPEIKKRYSESKK